MSPPNHERPPLRVSVVICTADRMETLPHALEAVRRQTYRPLEIVIVVGPCTDGTLAFVQTMSDVKVRQVDRLNLSHSRNAGIAAAGGDVIAFVDDDALPSPRWVEQLVRVYEGEGPDCGGVGGVTVNEREPARPLQFRFGLIHETSQTDDVRDEPGAANAAAGPWFNRLHGTNMSFLREALRAAGGFDEAIPYQFDEVDVCVRVIKAGFRVVQHGRALVHHFPAVSVVRPRYGRTDWPAWYRAAAYFRMKHANESRVRTLLHGLAREWGMLWAFVRRPSALWRKWPEVLHLWWHARGFLAGFLRGWRRPAIPLAPDLPSEFRPLASAPPVLDTPSANRPLNVALLCHSFGNLSNGINVYTLHLAEALTARGHSVTIFRAAGGAPLPAKGPRYRVVDVAAQGQLYQAAVGRQVYAAATYQPFDVVESPLWLGEGCALGMLVPYPLVVRLMTPTEVIRQTSDIPMTQALHASIVAERLVVNQAAGLIAISEGVRQTVEKVFDLRLAHAARQVAVIPLGLPSARAVKKARIAYPSTSSPHILFIGRLEGRKGVLELGEAFARLGRENHKASLWVVGQDNSANDGFQRKAGTNYVEALRGMWGPELSKRVHFFGPIEEDAKNYLLSQCDFLVAPSRYESFGLILLEAMRFGKAVVATAVGGMPEIVADGKTGLLVPPQSPEELSRAMMRLCEDEPLRAELGRAALERFHQEFEIGKCAERSVQFYRQVAEAWRDTMLTSFPPELRSLATVRS
jgi:glycosyltransferase involved in cell wall biosynthesis